MRPYFQARHIFDPNDRCLRFALTQPDGDVQPEIAQVHIERRTKELH